jgi:hypothetical protein
MAKKEFEQNAETDIDRNFNKEISIRRLFGNESAKKIVQSHIDQYYNDAALGRNAQLCPILLKGSIGVRTFAQAIHNSFSNLSLKSICSFWFTQGVEELNRFFHVEGDKYTTYFIRRLDCMSSAAQLTLHRILSEKQIMVWDMVENSFQKVSIENRLIICSASDLSKIAKALLRVFPIKVYIKKPSTEKLIAILNQRMSFLGWSAADSAVIRSIAQVAQNNTDRAFQILSNAYSVMRAENKDLLTFKHLNETLHRLNQNMQAVNSPET